MKIKKLLVFLVIVIASVCLFSLSNTVSAFTVSDDGEYALILNNWEENGEIDGLPSKVIKFNLDEGEDTVKLSELTKGVFVFNGRTEFSHWGQSISSDEAAKEEMKAEDFNTSGTCGDVSYTKGVVVWAKFSDKALQGSGTYYLTINPFAGKIDGKDTLKIITKSEEFKTVDLTKYKPVREGYTFVGWDFNGKFVKSIDASSFSECDVIEVTAVYTKDTYEGDSYVLNLNANGGKIEGEDSKKYDYVGGNNSGTSMPIFHYVPVRDGYTFKGWNTKKDGSGKNYKYVYWGFWRNEGTEFERETLQDNGLYKTLTLYANWAKDETTVEETQVIESSSETTGSIKFESNVNKNYRLEIQKVEVQKELENKDVKFVADINVLEGDNVVKISDTKMQIRIALPEELKNYDKYEVVYIEDGKIKETLPAKVENGEIVFETSHLSQYGIVAKNEEKVTNNPKTGDNIITSVILFVASITAIGVFTVVNKRK